MVNLLSIDSFRHVVPINAIVDDTIIASAINHAQVSLIPALTSREFYNELIYNLQHECLTPLQTQFLISIEPALACYSAYHLVPLAANQIHPTKLSDAMPNGSKRELQNYYLNQTSAYLYQVYDFCEANNIEYNLWKSTHFSSIVLGGLYS